MLYAVLDSLVCILIICKSTKIQECSKLSELVSSVKLNMSWASSKKHMRMTRYGRKKVELLNKEKVKLLSK